MEKKIAQLYSGGQPTVPIGLTRAIYNADGSRLDNTIEDISKSLSDIEYYCAIFYADKWNAAAAGGKEQRVTIPGLIAGTPIGPFFTETNSNITVTANLQKALTAMQSPEGFVAYAENGAIYWRINDTTAPTIDIPIYFQKVKINENEEEG